MIKCLMRTQRLSMYAKQHDNVIIWKQFHFLPGLVLVKEHRFGQKFMDNFSSAFFTILCYTEYFVNNHV